MAQGNLINYSKAAKIINYFGLILLFFLICISPHKLVYDEGHHIAIAKSILSIGLINTLTNPPTISALGPLYSFLQLSLIDLTNLNPPWIRFINFSIFLLTIVLLILISKKLKFNDPVLTGFCIMVVPFMYPTVGMALTEIPALFFFTLFCFFFIELMERLPTSPPLSIVSWATLAGLSLGVACLGRQTYLCALFATGIILKWDHKNLIAFFAVFISATAASLWLFWIWGGLTPPGLHIGGINVKHGILSFAYLGFATFFVCPEWFKLDRLIIMLLIIIFLILLLTSFSFNYEPATTLAKLVIPNSLFYYYKYIFDALFITFAVIWIYSLYSNIRFVWGRKEMVFLYFIIFILSLTPIAVSIQFSSRYIVTVLTLLVLILNSKIQIGLLSLVRFTFGILLGLASLATYYFH
jgi:hypothetical protein